MWVSVENWNLFLKNLMNIPELRNIVSEIKKSLDVFNGILDIAED